MPLHLNPKNPKIFKDMRNYRGNLAEDGRHEFARAEIKHHLKHRDDERAKAGKPKKKYEEDETKLKSIEAYKDFALWPPPEQEPKLNRLGGKFPDMHPNPNTPAPIKGQVKIVLPDHHDPRPHDPKSVSSTDGVEIEIRDDGAVRHRDDNGREIPEAHHYMHMIFNEILWEARRLLEDINVTLEKHAEQPTIENNQAYTNAVLAFEKFRAGLTSNDGNSDNAVVQKYARVFNTAVITPVVTNEGFIVSVRAELNWKNPYHSSSTIRVP